MLHRKSPAHAPGMEKMKAEEWAAAANAATTPHPKLTVLPIGINDRHVPDSHGDRRLLMASALALPPAAERPPEAVYANFHHSARLGWWSKPASGGRPDRAMALAALAPALALTPVSQPGAVSGGSAVEGYAAAGSSPDEADGTWSDGTWYDATLWQRMVPS